MPLKKLNKDQTNINCKNSRKKRKIDVKKRLMEISICVDNYIYNNKLVTLEEAQNYMQEISLYRTQPYNDIHILQVIEKLTRCMKSIIEETKLVLANQCNVISEHEQSIDIIPESSINNNEDCDVIIRESNFCATKKARTIISNTKHQKTSIITEIPEGANDDIKNKNTAKSITYPAALKDIKNYKTTFKNELESSNFKGRDIAIESIVVDMSNLATNNSLINTDISQLNNANDTINKYFMLNQVYCSNIAKKRKKDTNGNYMSIQENKEIMKKCKKNKAKLSQMSNIENKIIRKTSKKLKNKPIKSKSRLSKNNDRSKKAANNKKMPVNNGKEHISSSTFIVPVCSGTSIDTNREISLFKKDTNCNDIRKRDQDFISKQMDALKIYNKNVLNDLSWIKDIRYVREISAAEFEQTPNTFNEIFWKNLSLPNGLNEIDFIF